LLLPVAVAILSAQAATPTFSESSRNASLTDDLLNWTTSRGADIPSVPSGAALTQSESAYACLTALPSGQEIVVRELAAHYKAGSPQPEVFSYGIR
jgi:hypothetical protein